MKASKLTEEKKQARKLRLRTKREEMLLFHLTHGVEVKPSSKYTPHQSKRQAERYSKLSEVI